MWEIISFCISDIIIPVLLGIMERRKSGVKISLKAARVNAGYSQSTLAKKIGVSKSTISRWETGKLSVPDEKLDIICKIYTLNIEDLKK